jgi:hypothetical protein
MRQRGIVVAVVIGIAALVAASAARQAGAGGGQFGGSQILYGATGANTSSNLYTVNASTGATTVVGAMGHAITGLAVDPTSGVMYAVTTPQDGANPQTLLTVNRSTGATTIVASIGFTIADIAFTSSGALYGWSETDDGLMTINKTNGSASYVGAINLGTAGDGEAFSSAGVLYDMSQGSSGPLWTVNTSTGATTTAATLDGSGNTVNSATFSCDGSTLYANENLTNGSLITVNTTTGHVTTIGPTVAKFDALTTYCTGAVAATQRTPGEYCMPTAVKRVDGTFGRFVDLVLGQQLSDPKYANATPALFIQGYGVACELPGPGYTDSGTKVNLAGTKSGGADAIYEYFTK